MRYRLQSLILVFLLLLSAGPSLADAQGLVDRQQRASISLDRAVHMAESRYGAKAVKADAVDSGNGRVYHIRLLSSDGKVWTVRVDAQTGAMN